MRRVGGIGFLSALLLVSACLTTSEENIDSWEAGPYYFVTVKVSKLVMMMPKDDLAPDFSRSGGSTESARYFKFAAPDESLTISGWFEPDRLFEGGRRELEAEDSQQPGGPIP